MDDNIRSILASYGIRDDTPTYQETIAKPQDQWFYFAECSKCYTKYKTFSRSKRHIECKYCGYMLKWEIKLKGIDDIEIIQQDFARKRIK